MENIKIAIALDKQGQSGVVPQFFSETEHLLLVESASGKIVEDFKRDGASELDLAQVILRWNCECLLCGPIEEKPFLVIADEGCVTRYNASGLNFEQAVRAFNEDSLELIRDYINGPGCASEAEHGERECHDHD